jgi:hypothetical protein
MSSGGGTIKDSKYQKQIFIRFLCIFRVTYFYVKFITQPPVTLKNNVSRSRKKTKKMKKRLPVSFQTTPKSILFHNRYKMDQYVGFGLS